MNIIKKRIPKKIKLQIFAIIAIFIIIVSLIFVDILSKGPITTVLTDKRKIIEAVHGFGFFAPLLFMCLQILQIVISPIPGQVVGAVGGLLFSWWGILWTILGSAIGFFIVFYISRKFGRPLVEKIVKKESLDKFDFIAGEKAPLILFLIFLLPGFPDSAVCYIAGLTEVPIKHLMFMILVGRMPSVIVTNIFGDNIGEQDLTPIIIITVAMAIMAILAAIFRKPIMQFFNKISATHSDHQND